jgi:hypothetical protein
MEVVGLICNESDIAEYQVRVRVRVRVEVLN